ncbi:MAG: ABC transporter permease [Brevefilum sp.]|jgi:ABC-2 type transport system permease protein
MNKTWQIIKYEYTKHVLTKRFLFGLLSLPLTITLMLAVVFLIGYFSINTEPIGIVDQSGIIQDISSPIEEGSLFNPKITFQLYRGEEQAKSDLNAEIIQAYYIIPKEYPQNTHVQLFYNEQPEHNAQAQFNQLVRRNLKLFDNIDPPIWERLQSGNITTVTSLDGSREMNQNQWYQILTPLVAGILLIIVVMTSGGYLLQAVVEEKENRTMEIVISSVSPSKLMAGKIIGNIGVGLTQLAVWLLFGWLALAIGGRFWPVLADFSLPTNYILVLLLTLTPTFIMVAAIMAAIGSTMTEMQEAQQVSSLFSLSMTIPYYFIGAIMENPNSTLTKALNFFPLTSSLTLLFRMGFTVIPTWQILLTITILFLFALAAVWFAGRAFRLGMLQYGKKLSIKEVLKRGQA